MIISVTEQFHDHEPKQYFLDTDKMDKANYVESLILKASKKKSKTLNVNIDASNWEENPLFADTVPGVNNKSKIKKPKQIDKALYLVIDFDC